MRIKFASQKGAALVEFALILIPLLILTFGLIEFGLLMYNQQVLTNASREGARAGIVVSEDRLDPGPVVPMTEAACDALKKSLTDPVSISCVVGKYCRDHLVTLSESPTSPQVVVNGYALKAPFGSNLTVQVNYEYSFLVVPNFIPGITNPHPMQAITVMKYE